MHRRPDCLRSGRRRKGEYSGLSINDPGVERRHAARAEHALAHRYVDAVLEDAEIGVPVGAGELALAAGPALELGVVEHDAVRCEARTGLAAEPPHDLGVLSPLVVDDDDVVIDRQLA